MLMGPYGQTITSHDIDIDYETQDNYVDPHLPATVLCAGVPIHRLFLPSNTKALAVPSGQTGHYFNTLHWHEYLQPSIGQRELQARSILTGFPQ